MAIITKKRTEGSECGGAIIISAEVLSSVLQCRATVERAICDCDSDLRVKRGGCAPTNRGSVWFGLPKTEGEGGLPRPQQP